MSASSRLASWNSPSRTFADLHSRPVEPPPPRARGPQETTTVKLRFLWGFSKTDAVVSRYSSTISTKQIHKRFSTFISKTITLNRKNREPLRERDAGSRRGRRRGVLQCAVNVLPRREGFRIFTSSYVGTGFFVFFSFALFFARTCWEYVEKGDTWKMTWYTTLFITC